MLLLNNPALVLEHHLTRLLFSCVCRLFHFVQRYVLLNVFFNESALCCTYLKFYFLVFYVQQRNVYGGGFAPPTGTVPPPSGGYGAPTQQVPTGQGPPQYGNPTGFGTTPPMAPPPQSNVAMFAPPTSGSAPPTVDYSAQQSPTRPAPPKSSVQFFSMAGSSFFYCRSYSFLLKDIFDVFSLHISDVLIIHLFSFSTMSYYYLNY